MLKCAAFDNSSYYIRKSSFFNTTYLSDSFTLGNLVTIFFKFSAIGKPKWKRHLQKLHRNKRGI